MVTRKPMEDPEQGLDRLLDGYVTVLDTLVGPFQEQGGVVQLGAKAPGSSRGERVSGVTQVEYCTGWAGRRLSSESCMVNVTSTEAGATVTRTADAVVVAVPLGVLQAQSIAFLPELPSSHTATGTVVSSPVGGKRLAVEGWVARNRVDAKQANER
eukprot:Skav233780  [mRNA]  locus=scaffold780:186129:189558:- [translate_table: standard]